MITFFKHIIVVLMAGLLSIHVLAGDIFSEGVQAHSDKNYALAIEKFTAVIEESPNDVSAYYNLGLANMGNESYGAAIWAFEKVLKFTPNDSEATEKIDYCHTQLHPSEEWSPVLGSFESGLYSVSSDMWSYASILLSILLCLSIIFFKRQQTLSVKRVLLVFAFCSAVLLIFTVLIAAGSRSYQEEVNHAVITQPSIPTFIDEGNTAKTNLMEGYRVELIDTDSLEYIRVLDNIGDEYLVRYADLTFI